MWIHPENSITVAVIPYIFSLESWSVLHKWHPKEKIFLSKTLHVFQSFWKLLVCSFRKEDSRQTAHYCNNSHYQEAVGLAQSTLKQVSGQECKCCRNLAFIKELTENTISGAATKASIDMALTNATPRPRKHVGITSAVNWKPTLNANDAKNLPSMNTIILGKPSETC